MPSSNLIFLHGAPSVGKLTVANAIATHTKIVLLDNHVLIDFAKAVLDFGVNGFFDLVRASRILAIEHAAQQHAPLIVCTSCYSDPEDREQIDEICETLTKHGGILLPVFLTCSKEAQHERVASLDRAARKKVTSVEGLENFSKQWNFVQIPRDNCFTLDTTRLLPEEAAKRILDHFKIQL